MHKIKFNNPDMPFSENDELAEGLMELSNYINAVQGSEMMDTEFPKCPFSDQELIYLIGELSAHFGFLAKVTSDSGHSVVIA